MLLPLQNGAICFSCSSAHAHPFQSSSLVKPFITVKIFIFKKRPQFVRPEFPYCLNNVSLCFNIMHTKSAEEATFLILSQSQNKIEGTLPFPGHLSSVFSMECVLSVYFNNKKSVRFVRTSEEDGKR